MGEQVEEEVCLGKVERGVDAFQNFTDTEPANPSSFTPERLESL